MDPLSDAKIIDSWKSNAGAWTDAVRENKIESRNLVTNRAILDAIVARSPQSVIDIGCGEGWLVRALSSAGISAIGVDAIPSLIERANDAGGGDFRVVSYGQIAAGELDERSDVAVANFSLIGKDSVDELVRVVPSLLNASGALIVQTLHPLTAAGELPYEDGWRTGSWAGFGSEFSDPAPWFFRTMETWRKLFDESGFSSLDVREPVNPSTGKAVSALFIAEIA